MSRVFSVGVGQGSFGRREDGSLTIFSLFIFILILMIAGMAVDLVQHERKRVAVQNTLDTAVLAAGSLASGTSTNAEITAMVKDYAAKAGIDPDTVTVNPQITGASSRIVTASASFEIDTIFMNLMGIEELNGGAIGRAEEGQQQVEIVLVLDVSGSMSQGGKIEALRPAAKGFVTEVISRLGADRVSISIVPYNHQVHLDDPLKARIPWKNELRTVAGAPSHSGAIQNYNTLNPSTRCARFRDADFTSTSLGAVEGSAMFSGLSDGSSSSYAQYPSSVAWCSSYFAPVYLYQNSETNLHNFIDTLRGEGWTSIDYGIKWGVGLLDSSFAPVVQDMVNNNLLVAQMAGHPAVFTEPDVKKVIVLMTDGMNTAHLDLDDAYKSGPSRIWHSASLANGNAFDGFLVEMPSNPASQRWYRPRSPLTGNDDAYLASLPSDAVQWSYHQIYDRFRVRDVGNYFFRNDSAARNAHQNARIDVGGYAAADTRTRTICTEARNAGVDIYTIAFQAPSSSETLLRDCAGQAGRYFDVDGLDIATAFDAIAIELTKLRLTQ
jgi:Flp pilus assembly protein TadG